MPVRAKRLIYSSLKTLCPLLCPPTIFFEHIWEHLRQGPLERFTYEKQVRARGSKWAYLLGTRPEPGALPS